LVQDEWRLDFRFDAAALARLDQDRSRRHRSTRMDEADALGFKRAQLKFRNQLCRASGREDHRHLRAISRVAIGRCDEFCESRATASARDSPARVRTLAA